MKKINIAIVGLGNISKKHIEAIKKIKNFNLVSVCDPKEKIQNIKTYKDISNMLIKQKNIDIVSICSPSGLHYNHVMQSLKFKKNIIVEKPICMNFKQSKEILNFSKKNKKKVFVVYQNRQNPLIKYVKNIIKKKSLGKLITFNSSLYWNREYKYFRGSKWRGTKKFDGGVVMNQGSHNIDIFCNFFGDVKSVYCTKVKIKKYIECEDTCIVSFVFKSGLIGSFTLSTAVSKEKYSNEIEILGEKKNVKLSGKNLDILQYQRKVKATKTLSNLHTDFYKNIYSSLIKKKKNIFSISTTMHCTKVLDAINKSLITNSKIYL